MKSVSEIFKEGRTCYKFSSKKIDISLLEEIYNLMKLGPTAANCCPLRIIFVQSEPEKLKLISCLDAGNITKVQSAPVTAIFANDQNFFDKLPMLFPMAPDMKDKFVNNKELARSDAFRNATLQAAYFMIIARAKGLDCGPMSGFNQEKVDHAFLAGTSYNSNFLCNLGYKIQDNPYPRLNKLNFEDVCRII